VEPPGHDFLPIELRGAAGIAAHMLRFCRVEPALYLLQRGPSSSKG
jgi:hypothetical protein